MIDVVILFLALEVLFKKNLNPFSQRDHNNTIYIRKNNTNSNRQIFNSILRISIADTLHLTIINENKEKLVDVASVTLKV